MNTNLFVRQLAALSYPTQNCGPLIQTVRWIKPRFRPIAKSKMFRVRKPTPIDTVEYRQLQFLTNAYKTHMRGIRTYFLTQLEEKIKKTELMKKTDFSEDIQEFEQLLKENDLWNEQVRKEREADMVLVEERLELSYQKRKEKFQKLKLRLMMEAEEKILREKDTIFITEENLDVAIEKVIDSEVDYNYAIDKQGNIIRDESKTLADKERSDSKKIDKSL